MTLPSWFSASVNDCTAYLHAHGYKRQPDGVWHNPTTGEMAKVMKVTKPYLSYRIATPPESSLPGSEDVMVVGVGDATFEGVRAM